MNATTMENFNLIKKNNLHDAILCILPMPMSQFLINSRSLNINISIIDSPNRLCHYLSKYFFTNPASSAA